jgi:hypothetical protein
MNFLLQSPSPKQIFTREKCFKWQWVCRVSRTPPSQPFDKESGDRQAVSKQPAKPSVSLQYASGGTNCLT